MALAPALLPGYQYRVKDNGGDLAGEIVTVVDNNTFPDTDPRRRRATFSHDGNIVYLLPRVIEDTPVKNTPVTSPEALAYQHGGVLLLDEVTGHQPLPVANPQVVAFDAEQQQALVRSSIGAANPITDPMDDRLDHWRPKRAKVKRYVNRYMPNGWSDIEFLLMYQTDPYRRMNQMHPVNLALRGDTQAGKTLLVEALAVAWSDWMKAEQIRKGEPVTFTKPMPVFTLSGSSGVTEYDLFGQTTNWTDPATGQSHLVWLPGIAALAAQCGGILYLDEMNAMRGNVTSALHSLVDSRHNFVNTRNPEMKDGQIMAQVVTASLDLWVIATINEGYRDMGIANEAWNARFENILWGYDDKVETTLVKCPPIRAFADALRTARAAKAISTPVGTKSLEMFKLNVEHMGIDMAFATFLGMFQPQERKKVSDIFVDRTFKGMLEDWLTQSALNAAADEDEATEVEESPF